MGKILYYPGVRLSFVVPAYNEEAYLPACLESIVAQTRELGDAVEVIVVNNASTDRTREVALAVPGVRVVDEPRKGLTFARQAGFAGQLRRAHRQRRLGRAPAARLGRLCAERVRPEPEARLP